MPDAEPLMIVEKVRCCLNFLSFLIVQFGFYVLLSEYELIYLVKGARELFSEHKGNIARIKFLKGHPWLRQGMVVLTMRHF